jgi:hypothetical protein
VRIFKYKWFAKFAQKEGISDAKLCQAVKDAEAGRIDADYGGGVIKQRIARLNEGKSGGYRSIILYRRGHRAFFVYGFAKSDRENVSKADEQAFKESAEAVFSFSDDEIEKLLKAGIYKEILCNEQDI